MYKIISPRVQSLMHQYNSVSERAITSDLSEEALPAVICVLHYVLLLFCIVCYVMMLAKTSILDHFSTI